MKLSKDLLLFVIIFCISFVVGLFPARSVSNVSVAPTTIPTPAPHLDSMKIYNLVNDYRASQGLNKLIFDPSMCEYTKIRLSQIHSDWSHNGFNNQLPAYYSSHNWAGENLGKGYKVDKETVDAWIASPEHLENIVKPTYTRTCVEASDDFYIVQEFASY